MHVTEHLARATRPLFSFEIIPPPRGKSVQDITRIVEQVLPHEPPFIDVTSHPAEAFYEELGNGNVRRRIRKKRPGTLSICGIIKSHYGIDSVPHLVCRGFTREETEDAMIELAYLGIHNVLAIRGDEPNYKPVVSSNHSRNSFSSELVTQLADLRGGRYLEDITNSEPMDVCIGVGGYPEKHLESPNRKSDVAYLKQKVDAGADYIVTQMFFDNADFYRFVKDCREADITVPIIPGLKVLNRPRQLRSLPRDFHISLPEELVDEVMDSPRHAGKIGVRWGRQQVADLLDHGVQCIHFYVMSDASSVLEAIQDL